MTSFLFFKQEKNVNIDYSNADHEFSDNVILFLIILEKGFVSHSSVLYNWIFRTDPLKIFYRVPYNTFY